MKRDILKIKFKKNINGCCPAHDDWPNETYSSRRSKKARSREYGIKQSSIKQNYLDSFP